jgi:hypothetical protein
LKSSTGSEYLITSVLLPHYSMLITTNVIKTPVDLAE